MTPLDVLCEVGRRWAGHKFWVLGTTRLAQRPGPFWRPGWPVPARPWDGHPRMRTFLAFGTGPGQRRAEESRLYLRAEFVRLGAP